ncbi:helix-turn-helix transcriptional regulator [Actinokineospora sp. UTMC 2448]|uniref:helix-turn-helix domain-containing protein n=1 Tax=Actinokineospora sp. UTMC 2448 TaxID=2268449 RepID=UPI002164D6DC|nr:helix-turn-helix transcriptional regulator [Actinokineospora sp. UTMC 2448]UVS77543.1 Helix-turn-helix domain protein [Actinokineospora sp. UTMC 2448]
MGGARKPSQARDRAIGALLRTIRTERTDLSLEQAAAAVGISTPTLSRTENGKRHITVEDVASLLTVYKVPYAERESICATVRAPNLPGWWSRPLPGVTADVGTLAGYEATANVVTNWSNALVPGMLQTCAYAMGFMKIDGASDAEAEMRWLARLRRQQVLPTIDYTAFIHEAVLHTAYGGREALAEQLSHLHDVGTRGVGVRIVRRQPHAAMLHSWMLIEFPSCPPIVHVELQRSSVDLHDEEVDVYLGLRSTLNKIALSAAESRSMIERLIERVSP